MSNYIPSLLTSRFYDKDINIKIKAKFGLNPYSGQVSVIANITHYKKDIFGIVRTNTRKKLTNQLLSEITGDNIFVISSTIAFMKD